MAYAILYLFMLPLYNKNLYLYIYIETERLIYLKDIYYYAGERKE